MSWVVTAVSIASAVATAYGSYTQAQTQKKVAENNAAVAEINAQSAEAQGEKDAIKARQQGSQMAGAQRAGYAARGLDLGEGTPSDVIEETNFFTQVDQATARTNAAKNAAALRAGGASQQYQADSINPGLQLTGSLLGGASSVADRWHQYNKG